jgi:ornithine carbamoyltransferase
MTVRNFIDLDRFDTSTLRQILDLGRACKKGEHPFGPRPLEGRILAMVFEKPSTRTRVSFEAAIRQLGGDGIILAPSDTQLGRGESIADTARVLSRYVQAIMIRTDRATKLAELAAHATVPVINGLTDTSHPCQVMADVMTFEEHRGPLEGRIVAWIGDGNNVAASWIHAAAHFGFEMRLACPTELMPPPSVVDEARGRGARIRLTTDPGEAATGADCVLTDTWLSMGFREENRSQLLAPYQVNEALMAHAKPEAIFMHCLPAHRGEEVTAGVIDGPQSVVWDEAENRLHVQKGILLWCLR